MFRILALTLVATSLQAQTRFWSVGAKDGALGLVYARDSIWVFGATPEGPFAARASTRTMSTLADSALVLQYPGTSAVHFSYYDEELQDTMTMELVRQSADSAAAYRVVGAIGGWSAAVVLSPDSARRFFMLLHGRPAVAATISRDTTYFDFQVQKQAGMTGGTAHPMYPEPHRRAGLSGEVLAQFAIDTTGLVDLSTFKILKSTSPWFASAVFASLPGSKFQPAEIAGRKVRELIQEPFAFGTRR